MRTTSVILSFIFISCQETPMDAMNQPYTLGIWTVKPGKEEAFIVAWKSFTKWTAANQPGAGIGYLLQDSEDQQQFISFGGWKNSDVISEWRERPEFRAFVAEVQGLCEGFQPKSMVLVAKSE